MVTNDCAVEAADIEPHKILDILEPLQKLPRTNAVNKGNNAAAWVSWRPSDAPLSTAWLIGFNDKVLFLGCTGSLAEARWRNREPSSAKTYRQ